MGTLFGHKSRFLLNHDVVFLGELLLALRQFACQPEAVADGYRSYHCMALPSIDEIPVELEIAACVNVVLAEFKVRDHLEDSPTLSWRIANSVFSANFASAARLLEKYDFPLPEAFDWLARQVQLEQQVQGQCGETARRRMQEPVTAELAHERFDYDLLHSLCEPTAMITASFFSKAAKACGHFFSAAEDTAAVLFEVGFKFGCLVYVLDALEDYDKDRKRRQFNALSVCATLGHDEPLTDGARTAAVASIKHHLNSIVDSLRTLPLAESSREMFVDRFRVNTGNRLKRFALRGCNASMKRSGGATCYRPSSAVGGMRERIAFAHERANAWLSRPPVVEPQPSATRVSIAVEVIEQWCKYLYCFVFAVVFPKQVENATEWRHCFELPFNLIFWSSVATDIRSGVLQPFGVLAIGPMPGPTPNPSPGGRRGGRQRESGREERSCCGCMECCDGCADCGGCGECCGGCSDCACGDCCGGCGDCGACGDCCGGCGDCAGGCGDCGACSCN